MATTKNSYFLQFTVEHPRIGGGTLVLFWSLKVEDNTTPDQIMEALYGQCETIVRKQTGITVD